jgi:WD40-like Beta Propeller Repeat
MERGRLTLRRWHPAVRASAAPRRGSRLLAVALLATLLVAAPASAAQTHLFAGSFGPDGTSASHFSFRPNSLGVDQTTGGILVGEVFTDRAIEKFNAFHEPEPFTGLSPNVVGGKLTGFGFPPFPDQIAVSPVTRTIYFANPEGSLSAVQPNGEPLNFTSGAGAGTNEIPGANVCGVAVDSSGDIYMTEWSANVRVFAPSGEPLATIPAGEACELAVDAAGAVYVAGFPNPEFGEPAGPVQKFVPSTFPVTSSTTYEAAGTIDPTPSFAVAIDPSTNHLYVDEGNQIAEFDNAGTRLGAFGSTGAGAIPPATSWTAGLAVNGTTGEVYIAQGDFEGQVEVFGPAITVPDVTTGEATELDPSGSVTLNGTVNPDGIEVRECVFEYGTTPEYGLEASCDQVVGAGNEPVEVSTRLSGLTPGATYHFRLKAANAEGPNYGADAEVSMPPMPTIGAVSVTDLTSTSADLNATINPGGLDTTYYFQYGTDTHYGTTVPVPAADIGAGTTGVAVTQHAVKLEPDIPYHWRVVATSRAGTTTGADHTFLYDTSGETLPDNRAYEMVSPPDKNGATITDVFIGNLEDVSQDGNRVLLSSIQCFAGSESCTADRQSEGEQLLFTRTTSGWLTTPLAPPASRFPISSTTRASADTGMELFSIPTPPAEEDDFYLRRPDGTFVDVGPTSPPADGALGQSNHVLAPSDFARVVFQQNEPRWPESGEGRAVFEYSGTGQTVPTLVGVTGGRGSTALISACGTELAQGLNPGQMSADGETVFFSALACGSGTGENTGIAVPATTLYARIAASRTVKVSAQSETQCTTEACKNSPPADAHFTAASSDGSKVYFTSDQQLTDSASASGNLYEYDLSRTPQENPIDVSAGELSGHGPRVQGVVAASDDGSHVYFVAQGVLTTAANREGESAVDGADNLYVFARDAANPAGRIAFVARLVDADSPQWAGNGEAIANVTPDGRFLVFASHAMLTRDVTRGDGAAQIFRYDATTGELVRVSVGQRGFNDNGNAGIGDAKIVQAYRGAARGGPARRDPTMAHSGSVIFFESPIALTPHALNDRQIAVEELSHQPIYAENIYEWHEGRVSLISDGHDVAEIGQISATRLVGSDASGANVFFVTTDPLVPADSDTQLDVYDARVCTAADPCIPPAVPPLPPCSGEACHGIPAGTPNVPNAPSATFDGPGNVQPAAPSGTGSRGLTRRQRLAQALRACHRHHKLKRRRACERAAHRAYGPPHKARRSAQTGVRKRGAR